MDMLRPEDEEVLEELLDEGQFDWDTIQRYVRQCEQEGVSFDLLRFRSGHFYRPDIVQIGIEIQNRSPHWITLSQMGTTTSISITSGRRSLTRPAKALRMMLAAQIFCTAGAQGYPSNMNALRHGLH